MQTLTHTFRYLFGIIFIALISLPTCAQASDHKLVILTWSEYLSEELIRQFEQQFSAELHFVYFESDDHRDQIINQTGGKGIDLILVNGTNLDLYVRRKLIKPVPWELLPNARHINDSWRDAFSASSTYAVPYFWGTLGIAYRSDLVSKPFTSWKQLFDPAPELHGKTLIVNNSRDIIGMALKSLGYSANSEDTQELNQIMSLPLLSNPALAQFGYITLDADSSLVKGDIIATIAYGGDALNVAEHDDRIRYVIPDEGGNIWVDYFALAANTNNTRLAMQFLNFINQPENAAINAEAMYLATANTGAHQFLPEAILKDPVIYPDTSLLEKSELYRPLSPQAYRTRATLFSRISR